MKKRKIALGPGASSLILIVVVLSMCMLSMLTMVSAKNDESLSKRSASMIENVYNLSSVSEAKLAALDAVLVQCAKENTSDEAYLAAIGENLPEGMEMDENTVTWTENLNERNMECIVEILGLSDSQNGRFIWKTHRLTLEESEEEEDWDW